MDKSGEVRFGRFGLGEAVTERYGSAWSGRFGMVRLLG